MNSVNFHNANPTTVDLQHGGSANNCNLVISATGKCLPESDAASSDNHTTPDEKVISSRSTKPASGIASDSPISQDLDTQIETELSHFLQERNIDRKYLETLQHILASENTTLSQIPPVDLQNMLRSLNFSQVSKDDNCFEEYHIKLIKTGVVFFTWTALNGTSIFNGCNHHSKINYVAHIIQTARNLDKQHHPVLVIYSNQDMSRQCVQEMDSFFADEPNIITLCQERDLLLHCAGTQIGLRQNDHMRLAILNDQHKVFTKATEHATKYMKSSALTNLMACQTASFIYSDMDNHFLRIPDYLIAFDGAIDATRLHYGFIQDIAQYPGLHLLTKIDSVSILLNPDDSNTANEKKAIQIIDNIWTYLKINPTTEPTSKTMQDLYYQLADLAITIMRDKASQTIEEIKKEIKTHSLQNELDNMITHRNENDEKHPQSGFFYGDNGFLICSPNNHKLLNTFNKSREGFISEIKFHSSEKRKYPTIATFYNQHHIKANELTGYQLIDSVIIGHDGSWSNKCSKVLLEYFVNHEKITIYIDHTGSCLMFAINDSASQIKKFSLKRPDALSE